MKSALRPFIALTALLAMGAANATLAPVDEYFGKQHWSPLGIRHKIFSLKDDLHHARSRPDSVQHDAEIAEDALNDWMTRFPSDPWLPATAWNLATLYEELPGPDAQTHALSVLHTIQSRFGATAYAGYAARDLARGIGVRPWPHWAGSPPPPPPPGDAQALALAVQADPTQAPALEQRFWQLSHDGSDPQYARAAWELAAAYQRLSGEDARSHSIRLLALLVDRYGDTVFGRWALRDLERGVGVR